MRQVFIIKARHEGCAIKLYFDNSINVYLSVNRGLNGSKSSSSRKVNGTLRSKIQRKFSGFSQYTYLSTSSRIFRSLDLRSRSPRSLTADTLFVVKSFMCRKDEIISELLPQSEHCASDLFELIIYLIFIYVYVNFSSKNYRSVLNY